VDSHKCTSMISAIFHSRWPKSAMLHEMQHSATSRSSVTGASTKELMRRGGHASPAAALRYQHATEDRDRAIAEALDQLAQGTVIPIDSDPTGNRSRPQRARRGRGET